MLVSIEDMRSQNLAEVVPLWTLVRQRRRKEIPPSPFPQVDQIPDRLELLLALSCLQDLPAQLGKSFSLSRTSMESGAAA